MTIRSLQGTHVELVPSTVVSSKMSSRVTTAAATTWLSRRDGDAREATEWHSGGELHRILWLSRSTAPLLDGGRIELEGRVDDGRCSTASA